MKTVLMVKPTLEASAPGLLQRNLAYHFRDYRDLVGIYRDDGRENGHCYLGFRFRLGTPRSHGLGDFNVDLNILYWKP